MNTTFYALQSSAELLNFASFLRFSFATLSTHLAMSRRNASPMAMGRTPGFVDPTPVLLLRFIHFMMRVSYQNGPRRSISKILHLVDFPHGGSFCGACRVQGTELMLSLGDEYVPAIGC